MSTLFEVADIVCRRDDVDLFAPVSGRVGAGQLVELTGPNGSGKTTLLRTLAGLHGQYAGSLTAPQDGALYQGHSLGLDELLTPLENLSWFAALGGRQEDAAGDEERLRRVDMLAHAMTPVQRLSQGQRRRVAIARWLASPARVWLLDEPLTALDVDGQALLNDVVAQHVRGGGAVIAATHAPLTAEAPTRTAWQLEMATTDLDANRDAGDAW